MLLIRTPRITASDDLHAFPLPARPTRHMCVVKGIVCRKITQPNCFKDTGSWTGNKNLFKLNSTTWLSLPNSRGKPAWGGEKTKWRMSNTRINVKCSETPEGKFKLCVSMGVGAVDTEIENRTVIAQITQCRLYRGLSPCEHTRQNTTIHHSCQACQTERGQVFLFQNKVLSQFLHVIQGSSQKAACPLCFFYLLLQFLATITLNSSEEK